MAASYREYRVFPGPIEYYIGAVRSIASSGLKFSVTGETPIQDGLLFFLKHGVSFSSWGENVKLALISQGNQTVADIDSECALVTQIVDWGKNKENVMTLFRFLQQASERFQQNPMQYWQSQPRSPQAVTGGTRFCPQCGKALENARAFCTNCGARLL